jgi:hypothetical protein
VSDRAVLKWDVPVDDQPHEVGGGEVVSVACQHPDHRPDVVTIWTIETRPALTDPKRTVQVYGTGHPLPFFAIPLGTAIVMSGNLVWHLMELPPVLSGTVAPNDKRELKDTWP